MRKTRIGDRRSPRKERTSSKQRAEETGDNGKRTMDEQVEDDNDNSSEFSTEQSSSAAGADKSTTFSPQPRGLSRSMLDVEDSNFVHRQHLTDLQSKASKLELHVHVLQEQIAVRERERTEYELDVLRERRKMEELIIREREAHEVEMRATMRQVQLLKAKLRQETEENKAHRRHKDTQAWSDAKTLEDFRRTRLYKTYLGDDFHSAVSQVGTSVNVGLADALGSNFGGGGGASRMAGLYDQVQNIGALSDLTAQISRHLSKSKHDIKAIKKTRK